MPGLPNAALKMVECRAAVCQRARTSGALPVWLLLLEAVLRTRLGDGRRSAASSSDAPLECASTYMQRTVAVCHGVYCTKARIASDGSGRW